MKQKTINGDARLNYVCPTITENRVAPELMFQSGSASSIDYLTEEEGTFEWN